MPTITVVSFACAAVAMGVVAAVHTAPEPDPHAIARALGGTASPLPPIAPLHATWMAGAPTPAPACESRPAAAASAATVDFAAGPPARPVGRHAELAAFALGCGAQPQPNPCASDHDAVQRVLAGTAEFAVVTSALHAGDAAAGVRAHPVGTELYALVVATQNTVPSLTRQQVRHLLTGDAVDWRDVGSGVGAMVVYVPREADVAARATSVLIPGDRFSRACIPIAAAELPQALAQPNAIAVVRLGRGPLPATLRAVPIEWNPPTVDAWRMGAYAYGLQFAVVTPGAPGSGAARLLARMRDADGAAALAAAGLHGP
ncbi:MAG: hypothetical protein ACK56S_03420 [Planctomycetota bacterium]